MGGNMVDGQAQTWPGLLARLVAGVDLDAADTEWVMDKVLAGDATPVQLAGFLVALRSKGETAAEITGLAEAMLRHTRRVALPTSGTGPAIDVVGTGGDHAHTVNISSMSAVVAAAAGVPGTAATGPRPRPAAPPTSWRSSGWRPPPGAVAACVAGRHRLLLRGGSPLDAPHLGAPPGGHPGDNVLGPLTNPAQPNAGSSVR
jgi:anthranilate phosphoribosyltransferase